MSTQLQHKQNTDIAYGSIMLLMAAMLVAGITTGAPLPEFLRIIGLVVAAVTAGLGLGAISPWLHEHKGPR